MRKTVFLIVAIMFSVAIPCPLVLGWQEYLFSGYWPEGVVGFCYPGDVEVDNVGNIYVADTANDCIKKLDSDGTLLKQWGIFGKDDGEFISPYGLSVDASGNVYVADTGNHRIQKFDSEGNFLIKWGAKGSSDGQFSTPNGELIRCVFLYYPGG